MKVCTDPDTVLKEPVNGSRVFGFCTAASVLAASRQADKENRMIVLNPEGKARAASERIPALPRFADLNGRTVGFLDNSKPNNDLLQSRFEQLLRQNCDVSVVVRRRKLTAQQGAPRNYLDELAAQADFVISGLGD